MSSLKFNKKPQIDVTSNKKSQKETSETYSKESGSLLQKNNISSQFCSSIPSDCQQQTDPNPSTIRIETEPACSSEGAFFSSLMLKKKLSVTKTDNRANKIYELQPTINKHLKSGLKKHTVS